MTVGFVVEPIPIVDVAVGMEELPSSTSLIILPLAFIACLIWPNHSALSVPQATFPLALVDCTCFVVVSASLDCFVFLVHTTQRLFRLIMFEVFAVNFRSHFQYLVLASLQETTHQRLDPNQHSVVVTALA